MSRAGYSDDLDPLDLGRWRGQVASIIRGRRGQSFLKELLASLDDMPEKRLITEELIKDGEVCALGALAIKRDSDISNIDPYDYDSISNKLNVAHQLAQEIMYINDECDKGHWEDIEINGASKRKWVEDTPEERWIRVREWVSRQIHVNSP